MGDQNNWEREHMRDRGNESNRENWRRGREGEREREGQFAGGEERNRNWQGEGRYGQGGEGYRNQGYRNQDYRDYGNEGRGWEGRREFDNARDPYYSGRDYSGSSEGRWNEGRGYAGGERGYEGPRGYESSRGYEGARGYEGSRGYDPKRAYEGSRGGYEGFHGRYEGPREDYGPGAFNRQFRSGPEYFGTGQRGFGTTWGGAGSYSGGQGAYGGGLATYGEQGRFSGRGPKGYQRSDDRIREDVCERLTQHPEIDAVDIEIQVKNGEVTLMGTVDRRDEKRLAEDVAESVSGVKDVHNQLRAQQHQGVTAGQGSHGSKPETAGVTATKTK